MSGGMSGGWAAQMAREAAASQTRFMRESAEADLNFRKRQSRVVGRDDEQPDGNDDKGNDDDAVVSQASPATEDRSYRSGGGRFA